MVLGTIFYSPHVTCSKSRSAQYVQIRAVSNRHEQRHSTVRGQSTLELRPVFDS